MDGYPAHLAPEFEESGAVATPFHDWWARVGSHFAHVPEQVAEDWLHRHWSHSHFGWLSSTDYRFRLVDWPSTSIAEIRTGWSNFVDDPAESIAHGRFLVTDHHQRWGYPLAGYMLEHATFPVPPVILDNQDDHLALNPVAHVPLPAAILLVEGHRRFNIANYLAHKGLLKESVPVWLMERARS